MSQGAWDKERATGPLAAAAVPSVEDSLTPVINSTVPAAGR